MRRTTAIVTFPQRPADKATQNALDLLQRVLGRLVSFADVALLLEAGGYTATNAAAAPGTALTFTRTKIDFGDAGADQLRLVVRGNNSGVGSVTVQLYDVTGARALCSVIVTGATPTTYDGDWTSFKPRGGEQEIELRVIGDGAFDPVLYAVHLQMRTLNARQ